MFSPQDIANMTGQGQGQQGQGQTQPFFGGMFNPSMVGMYSQNPMQGGQNPMQGLFNQAPQNVVQYLQSIAPQPQAASPGIDPATTILNPQGNGGAPRTASGLGFPFNMLLPAGS